MTARVLEQRATPGVVQLRAASDGTTHIGGYALKWNTMSRNLGGFVETIAPDACNKTIADGGEVFCRWDHDSARMLGTRSAGTLTLVTDGIGLDYDCSLSQATYARDCAIAAERGDLRFSSFAFRAIEDEWGFTPDGFPLRTLVQFQLIDVAPVFDPAYFDTSSGLRSLAEARSLDLDTVLKAAQANELGVLMRERDPKVFDLGALNGTGKRDMGCDCCDECVTAEDQCPGCECDECACDGPTIGTSEDNDAPRSNPTTTETSQPGDTHWRVKVRQRRAALHQRRPF